MIYILLFFNVFLVYLFTLFPTVAAYRDSGELSVVGYLLGVAHPPGYPLYSLLLNIFGRILPIGNFAYRYNIFSAVVSSLTSVSLFHLYNFLVGKFKLVLFNNKLLKNLVGYLICLTFSFGYLQWYLSLVSEMYTLNTLFAVNLLLLHSAYFLSNKRWIYLTFFIFFCGMGNRLDLLLFIPILLFIFLDYLKQVKLKNEVLLTLIFLSIIGLSCYLYLPIRSSQNPFIDWNHPAQLSRFWASLTRKTHGSTLDLISVGYLSGENFFDGFMFYLNHLINNFSILGIIFILFGIYKSIIINKFYGLALFFSWCLSCLFFIYKANMPPNPHAFAILEAHFLLPNTVIITWFIFGVLNLLEKISLYKIRLFILIFLFGLVLTNVKNNISKLNKRYNFYAYDYATNIMRTVPKKSILIIKEDVQIFSCWYKKFVENFRPDIYIVAAGLSGSLWYKEMCYNYYKKKSIEPIFIDYISEQSHFERLIENNLSKGFSIFITSDVEPIPTNKYDYIPYGLLLSVVNRGKSCSFEILDIAKKFYNEIYVYRGKYIYDLNWEFFSSDIIEDYSKALLNTSHWLMRNDYMGDETIMFYKMGINMNPDYPFIALELGYYYFKKNNLLQSEMWYNFATDRFEYYLSMAKRYKAQNSTIEEIKQQVANSYLHLGVVCEKNGKVYQAIEYYNKALNYNSCLSDAYYNLAVAYWKLKDWQKVIYYLKETLKLDPNHHEAKFYLEKAIQMAYKY